MGDPALNAIGKNNVSSYRGVGRCSVPRSGSPPWSWPPTPADRRPFVARVATATLELHLGEAAICLRPTAPVHQPLLRQTTLRARLDTSDTSVNKSGPPRVAKPPSREYRLPLYGLLDLRGANRIKEERGIEVGLVQRISVHEAREVAHG